MLKFLQIFRPHQTQTLLSHNGVPAYQILCRLSVVVAEPEREISMTNQTATSNNPKPPFSYGSLTDCDRPACDDMVSMMKKVSDVAATSTPTNSSPSSSPETNPASLSKNTKQILKSNTGENSASIEDCPPSSAKLGRSTWTLLHTMAAWYPNEPNETDQSLMQQFMKSIARFYPCPWCAHDFQINLQQKPPETGSRKELCQWLCEQHNVVNAKLGKPQFSCDMANLDERWRRSSKDPCRGGDH